MTIDIEKLANELNDIHWLGIPPPPIKYHSSSFQNQLRFKRLARHVARRELLARLEENLNSTADISITLVRTEELTKAIKEIEG